MTRTRSTSTRGVLLALALSSLATTAARAGGIILKNPTVTPINDPQYFYQYDFQLGPQGVLKYGDYVKLNDLVGVDSLSGANYIAPSGSPLTSLDYSSAFVMVVTKGSVTNGVAPISDVEWKFVGDPSLPSITNTSATTSLDLGIFGIYTDPTYTSLLNSGTGTNGVTGQESFTGSAHQIVNGKVQSVTTSGSFSPALTLQIQGIVPEPATITLGALGLGLVGLTRAARRRAAEV